MADKQIKNRGEYVFETLKEEILKLELAPGRLISENEICTRFEVSRTPVREALRRLQEQDYVRTIPYSGTYVSRINMDTIRQMIYMRVAVELMVMRDYRKIATAMMREEVRFMIRKQELLIAEPDFQPEQFYRLDASMHALWFDAVQKGKLWKFIQEQQLHYSRYRMLDFVTETDFTRIIREHNRLLELLEGGQDAALEEALKAHLYISMTRMKHAIEVEYRDYFEWSTSTALPN